MTTRRERTRKEEIKINLELACFTYNFSKSFQCVSTVSGGHDPRALLCVGRIGTILIHSFDCNSINAINITIIGTAVLSEASIACSKGVDSTTAPTALQHTNIRILWSPVNRATVEPQNVGRINRIGSNYDSLQKGRRSWGLFLESPGNVSYPESCFMSARFTLKIQDFVDFQS